MPKKELSEAMTSALAERCSEMGLPKKPCVKKVLANFAFGSRRHTLVVFSKSKWVGIYTLSIKKIMSGAIGSQS